MGTKVGEDAGVVASAFQCGGFTRARNGFLLLEDGGGGFEGDAEDQVFAVADSALNSAGAVGSGTNFSAFIVENIIVFRAFHRDRVETGSDLKAFGGGQGEHRFCEVCFQTVEHGNPQPRWDIAHHAFNDAPYRITLTANLIDQFNHLFGYFRMGTADDVTLHGFGVTVLESTSALR